MNMDEILDNIRDEDYIIDGKFPDIQSDIVSDKMTKMRNGEDSVIIYSSYVCVSKNSIKSLLPPTPSIYCSIHFVQYIRGFVFNGEIPRGIRVIFTGTSLVYDTSPYVNPNISNFVGFPLSKLLMSEVNFSGLIVTSIDEAECHLFEGLKVVQADRKLEYTGAALPYNPKISEFVVKNSQGGEKILKFSVNHGRIIFFNSDGIRYNPNSYIDCMGEFVGCYTKGVAK